MSIVFTKLVALMKGKNMSIYHLTRDKIIGKATLEKIRKDEGHVDTRSINAICKYLNCQPGDIMEYIPDEKE